MFRSVVVVLFCAFLFSLWVLPADAEVTYQFERMWPTLQQPWYFDGARDMTCDSAGNVYVTDAVFGVRTFDPDGRFALAFDDTIP
ncbi:MAG: hypothetical protein GY851_30355 [bacterium]|nr:hypothetical protein [bacterium]